MIQEILGAARFASRRSINVVFDSKITAEIAIESGENAALIRPVAKQLLLEFTDNAQL